VLLDDARAVAGQAEATAARRQARNRTFERFRTASPITDVAAAGGRSRLTVRDRGGGTC
jgi:hypothetical protein